jgi:alginate O-acetyltransferase complex protein AlgI
MVFSSPVFLFIFLPLCLAAAFAALPIDRVIGGKLPFSPGRHPAQNVVLLVFSMAFYVYGSGRDVLILLACVVISWLCGLLIHFTRFKRSTLFVGVVSQLGALAWFKYANFFVTQVSEVRVLAGAKPIEWQNVLLPIGISFFVFQAISYLIDVYRQECAPRKNPLDVALFIALFPQLIAGPIVRYVHVQAALEQRSATFDNIARGATRFIFGLFKKVVIADSVAQIADAAFALPPGEMTAPAALIGAVAYTFQIYFDFSAYSDMAIGIGHMFGFRFPENFNRPLTATSITDFWRRWHMTLSSCFRDYVYVPLGGSRGSSFQTYRNLWIVFLLSGLWHGANWTFVAWGAFHGLLLTIERMAGVKPDTGPRWRRALTFALVVIGFTLFRADTFTQALVFYRHIFVPLDWSLHVTMREVLTHKNLLFFAVAVGSTLLPLTFVTGRYLEEAETARAQVARLFVMTVLALYAVGIVASSNFSPFIYFRF